MSCEYVNRAWLEFTGYSAEQAAGDGWSRVVHAEDLARWLDACVRAFDARTPYELEYRMRRHDGAYRWVLERAAPQYSGDGAFAGFAAICVEIEERKRASQSLAHALERERRLRTATEEASRAKDGLLATVLADLQSPTHAIATWSEHLRRQLPKAPAARSEAAEPLEAIECAARMQNQVISSLLDLTRVNASPAPRPGLHDAPLLSGIRVLVVEEDAQARDLLLKILHLAGAQATAVQSSDEALRALDDWHPDVLLSGQRLNGDDGYVLVRALRTPLEPATPRVMAAGFDAQLAKPVEPVALLATVARLVQPARA
jgi:PAS domain S-box-containing protein